MAIPLLNCGDSPGRPALNVVCRFPGMKTVMVHTDKEIVALVNPHTAADSLFTICSMW
jgi:hypothetical protein